MSITCKVYSWDAVIYEDRKGQGFNGGTFTSGSWQTRELNYLVYSKQTGTPWASLSSNQITLQPGTYLIEATAPAFNTLRHQLRLYNTTDTTTDALGMGNHATTGGSGTENYDILCNIITITGAKTYELQHRCESTQATNGFGVATFNNSVTNDEGINVYAQIMIRKLK